MSVVDGAHAERERAHQNPTIHSKADRRYGKNVAQPAELYRDPVNPDAPITHHGGPPVAHVETVGHIPNTGGEFRRSTTPNADARTGTDRFFKGEPLRPVGMTHSKTGGEHGEPQTRPESKRPMVGSKSERLGRLNTARDRNRK